MAAGGEFALPPDFVNLRTRLGPVLGADEYWAVGALENEELEYYLQAAAFVAHGSQLLKYRKGGREKPHPRFVKVLPTGGGSGVELLWERKRARMVRADAEVYESCFQGAPPDKECGFQVILDKRMLFFVAGNSMWRDFWVSGINALVSGEVKLLAAEMMPIKAEGVPTPVPDDKEPDSLGP